MLVLGVDPGYDRCGYAIADCGTDSNVTVLSSGVIQTHRRFTLAVRLHELAGRLDELIAAWQPQVLAAEEIYFTKNVKTAIRVAQARGVLLEHAAAAGLEVVEYTPTEIKNQLTGNGHASKAQIAYIVERLVALPPTARLDDELDAIAAVLCYHQRLKAPAELKQPESTPGEKP